jgi:hypothetical protein
MKLGLPRVVASRAAERGISLLEVSISSAIFLGAMLIATKFQGTLQQGMRESNQRLERQSASSDILDRLDSLLRSSSSNLSPFRVLDTSSPLLRDRVDNDLDGNVDELDEAFATSPPLANGAETQAIWFQRVAGIDDSTVPPTIRYDAPSYVRFVPDRSDPRDGSDNDGDGLIDEGHVVVRVADGDQSIAGNVVGFAIARREQELIVRLAMARPVEGKQEPEILNLQRTIYVQNW